MKILCIGSSLLEITCGVNEIIRENETIRLEDKIECGGGHAGNIAYLLGKWGVETYIASMMGADDIANKIKKEYETIGVKTDYIETSYDKPTSQSLVLANTTNKNKTVLEIPSNTFLKKYSFGVEPNIIVSDGNDFNATVSACDKFPNAQSYLVVSRSNNEILELCKYVKFIIFNKSSAEKFSGMTIDYNDGSTLVNIYNKLKQKFSKADIIITLGERGSVYSINSQVKIMPTIRTNIVDTNGAGDVYAGTFIYAMGRNFGLEKSVAYATIAASLSTTKMTSRMSIPTLTEVSNYYDGKFGVQNNPNITNTNNGETAQINNANVQFQTTSNNVNQNHQSQMAESIQTLNSQNQNSQVQNSTNALNMNTTEENPINNVN